MPKDLASREGALDFIEFMKERVLDLFARRGEVLPHAIVFMTKSPDGKILLDEETQKPTVGLGWIHPTDMTNPEQKDGFTGYIATFLEKTGALGVVTIAECWMAVADPSKGLMRTDLPASFHTPFSGRREGIMILFEHVALEHPCEWWAEIQRSASGLGYTKPFTDMRKQLGGDYGADTRVGGRFTHQLRRSAS